MRIAVVCPNASSNSLVRTYPIAKVLQRRHELQIVGFRSADSIFDPYRDEFAYDTVRMKILPAFLDQVRTLARRIRADAIYVFKPLPSSLWVGLWAKRTLGIPLFLDIEDWEAGWYYDVALSHRLRHLAHIERPNGLLWTWLTEKVVGLADEIFVVSRFLQRLFGGTLLAHGADTTAFSPSVVTSREARHELGLGDGRYVVFTGSPMRSKGLDDLLSAVSRLGDPNLKVVVVGSFRHDMAYRKHLMDTYGDRLVVMSARPHAEMPLFLAAADIVAIPQRVSRETLAQVPGKIFEAMAMARPIVATTVSDLPEILDGCGVLVPPNSVDQLADGLAHLLDDPDRAIALGRAARRRCEERYSWDAMERTLADRLEKWEKR